MILARINEGGRNTILLRKFRETGLHCVSIAVQISEFLMVIEKVFLYILSGFTPMIIEKAF